MLTKHAWIAVNKLTMRIILTFATQKEAELWLNDLKADICKNYAVVKFTVHTRI